MRSGVLEIHLPDEGKVESDFLPLAARAQSLTVTSQEEHGAAQEYFKELAAFERGIVTLFEAPKSAANAAHKSICAAEKKLLGPVQEAKRVVGQALTRYEDEERERARLEQLRLEREAKEKADAAALAEAEAAAAAGDEELAEQVMESAIAAPPPPVYVPPKLAQTAGVSSRVTWRAEVTNLHALVKHVAANPGLIHLLEPNMTALNGQARGLREAMNIPGVRAVADRHQAVRAA